MSNFDFKFVVGDTVTINETDKKGTIVTRKVEETARSITYRYQVDAGGYHKGWYEDSQLSHDNGLPEASLVAKIIAIKSRIDYCLDTKDFLSLPDLHTELLELQGGEHGNV
ncbi:hypothetical protein FZC83_01830 [Rossellomorea marisflavi]|uniref:Uncharacterized protein n=1 Tax=Rossellomorea marisflavi TaxID=189381 RepID=A0A5D4RY66_9BACI|nr:hypothetical protein [Rossellomorea marisflavi]TYS56335.1 hypothetical protein FZC83_01830 [Rossellomorea marisflavi]